MTSPSDLRQPLEAAITDLRARRAVLGNALVDAALAPLLERLAALSAKPEPAPSPAPPTPTEPARRLRQVSVLFLDLVGSTQLIHLLDPEEVQAGLYLDGCYCGAWRHCRAWLWATGKLPDSMRIVTSYASTNF